MDRVMRNTTAKIMPSPQFGYSTEDDHRICEETTPFLNLDKLREEERNTDKTKLKMYKLILSKCHSKIRRTNNQIDVKECYFDIPIFLPGFPVYSVLEAKQYVLQKLYENGIYANDVGGNRIYISWKTEHIDYDQYKVTAQKMTPKQNPYKIAISPMDARNKPSNTTKEREAKIWQNEDTNNVSMFQYDVRYDDMVPVNKRKMNEQFPEISSSKQRKPSYMREDKPKQTYNNRNKNRNKHNNEIIDLDQHYFSDDNNF